ncbi:DUF6266 family protein [Myroides sp. M-43]|uniref:DUF6266 family protein n=1 Tax=Myroides oncorhynchi TaxID=2893756 RepID=UPI001E4FA92B|nr:DUF6266 family protein [Myroides oncorhynchi]MCC9042804.1 DUF6266 family protein [Myroides oncorhynchi]
MSLVSTYASKFRDFVNAHCPAVYNGEKWMIGKEQMISRMMKQGITMINGLQHIAVEQTILSIGNLAPAVIRKINIMKTGKFKVQWDNSLVNAMTLDTDSLSMMLYNETLDKFVAIHNVGNRVEKYAHFSVPTEWKSGKVYFWSMWKAADGSMHSTSCFHGMIELIEEQVTENGKEVAGNGKQVAGNENQGKRNTKQEITEVLPLEQVQRIALKQCLEEVASTSNTEITTESVVPAIKEGETTPPVMHPFKEGELKKWMPPGYTRRVTKRILKGEAEVDNSTKSSKKQRLSKPSGIIEGACSVLDVPKISEELNE